jgi:hypothetical protein
MLFMASIVPGFLLERALFLQFHHGIRAVEYMIDDSVIYSILFWYFYSKSCLLSFSSSFFLFSVRTSLSLVLINRLTNFWYICILSHLMQSFAFLRYLCVYFGCIAYLLSYWAVYWTSLTSICIIDDVIDIRREPKEKDLYTNGKWYTIFKQES